MELIELLRAAKNALAKKMNVSFDIDEFLRYMLAFQREEINSDIEEDGDISDADAADEDAADEDEDAADEDAKTLQMTLQMKLLWRIAWRTMIRRQKSARLPSLLTLLRSRLALQMPLLSGHCAPVSRMLIARR